MELTGPEPLRERIIEHLRRVGRDSISGVTRALNKDGPAPAHRLTVAGYLQAMTDAGLLTEVDDPPSKQFRLQNPEMHWSLHQRAWTAIQDLPRPPDEKARLLLAVLQSVLGRPVFQAELLHAGLREVPQDVERVVVGDEVRRGYRRLFDRKAWPRLEVPQRDPLFAVAASDPLIVSTLVQETVRRILVKSTGAEHLVASGLEPEQKRLELGGAP